MRKKLPENEKKIKTGITLNSKLFFLMEEYLNDIDINRSKYIEKLVKDDLKKRGKNIDEF